MHPSQVAPFRKTIIVLVCLLFGGCMLVYTSQANLDLLKSVYPEPRFYMFGLLAFEGGVILWTALYLLYVSGVHKALCLFCLGIDAVISGTGFFYEMETVTNKVGTITLPPIILIIGFAVVFNTGMLLIAHLLPDGMPLPKFPSFKRNQVEKTAIQLESREELDANLIAAGDQLDCDDNQVEKGPQYTHNKPVAGPNWGGKRNGAGKRERS